MSIQFKTSKDYPDPIKELIEKDKAKKLLIASSVINEVKYEVYYCPKCQEIQYEENKFCHNCGQRLNWDAIND